MDELIVHTDDGALAPGVLMAHLDRELPAPEAARVAAHLGECLSCRRALENVRVRSGSVTALLGALDRPAPVASAWSEVSRAIGPAPVRSRPSPRLPVWRFSLARAAGMALLLAGGAAAAVVPGSPLRSWLFGADEAAAPTVETAVQPASEAGTRTALADGAIEIALSLPAGTEVVLRWTGTGRAGVFGAGITSFDSPDEGRLEARAESGPVRVEIPTDATTATLRVNGSPVLTIRRGVVQRLPASADGALERDGSPVRFRLP